MCRVPKVNTQGTHRRSMACSYGGSSFCETPIFPESLPRDCSRRSGEVLRLVREADRRALAATLTMVDLLGAHSGLSSASIGEAVVYDDAST